MNKMKFAFNEDAEPVAELHRYREALSKKYKSVAALSAYYAEQPKRIPPAQPKRKKAANHPR